MTSDQGQRGRQKFRNGSRRSHDGEATGASVDETRGHERSLSTSPNDEPVFQEETWLERRTKPAREKVMDLLARRSHSELELREKLATHYDPTEIDEALQHARDEKWLPESDVLAEQVAQSLSRKGKGHGYINQFLKAKGLPPVAKDLDEEIAKGRSLVVSYAKKAKLPCEGPFTFEARMKIQRHLASRGFDGESVRTILDGFGYESTGDFDAESTADVDDAT